MQNILTYLHQLQSCLYKLLGHRLGTQVNLTMRIILALSKSHKHYVTFNVNITFSIDQQQDSSMLETNTMYFY